ncbi:quinolinate synthase NadA [Syntrophomonas erecta]
MNLQERELMDEILYLKNKNSIFILAHFYQRPEIQEIADYVGDSYSMAVAARNSSMPVILVAGVDFMAETAAILCPDKTILSPEPKATCPMANQVKLNDIIEYKKKNPDAAVVSYVNTPAAVKALSDVCCTSSNASRIISKLKPDQKVLFLPDRNLGQYVVNQLHRDLDTYPSCCPIHDCVKADNIKTLKSQYPEAAVLVHPECRPEVQELADYVGSTAGIVSYARETNHQVLIIATECGIFHTMSTSCPDKQLVLASEELICPNMKSITLEKIHYSILNRETVVTVSEDVRGQALEALEKMIEWSES